MNQNPSKVHTLFLITFRKFPNLHKNRIITDLCKTRRELMYPPPSFSSNQPCAILISIFPSLSFLFFFFFGGVFQSHYICSVNSLVWSLSDTTFFFYCLWTIVSLSSNINNPLISFLNIFWLFKKCLLYSWLVPVRI